jgi:hypothetical protein
MSKFLYFWLFEYCFNSLTYNVNEFLKFKEKNTKKEQEIITVIILQ